jgi:hypothetical protein
LLCSRATRDYCIAFCTAAGQLIGGMLGAQLVIKNGAKLICPVFISVVSMLIMPLLYANYASLG